MKVKAKFIVSIELFIINQILVNVALGFFYYFPDSLMGIYASAAAVILASIIEMILHYLEKQVPINKYPTFSKEEYISLEKPLSNEDSNWKINL